MSDTKNQNEAMSLTVTEGLTVTILPSLNHEFLMTTKQVANGYGISEYTLRRHKMEHGVELVDGKHFTTAVQIMNGDKSIPHNAILWTKRGVVRLGFFIKSERAKMFRDWAEELILYRNEVKQPSLFPEVSVKTKQLPAKRNHNRLTHERLLNIMADVCRIDDKDLRLSISEKLMKGGLA